MANARMFDNWYSIENDLKTSKTTFLKGSKSKRAISEKRRFAENLKEANKKAPMNRKEIAYLPMNPIAEKYAKNL